MAAFLKNYYHLRQINSDSVGTPDRMMVLEG